MWPIYLILGAFAGFFSGLLGIGGGLIIVPALTLIYAASGFGQEHLMHMSLGTSFACILLNSLTSLREHHHHGAVNWGIVKSATPGIIAGGLLGSLFASLLSTFILKIIFASFICYVAGQMLLGKKIRAKAESLPANFWVMAAGSLVGFISSLVGIGGATLSVPLMTWRNVKFHTAIGTAAAIGFPVALAGATGYLGTGFREKGLPPYSLGYIYLPAFLGISLTSFFAVKLGAKTAHRLQVQPLKKIFAAVLLLMAAKMLFSLS